MKNLLNKDLLKILIIAILTITIGIFANKFQPVQKFLATFSRPELNEESTIVYFQSEDKTVFAAETFLNKGEGEFENYTAKPTILTQNDIVTVSKDRNKIAYAQDNDDAHFYVKNVKENTELIVDNKEVSIQKLTFSPDGNYLVVISGASQNLVANVYETKEFTKYYNFEIQGFDVYWTDNDKAIINYNEVSKFPRPWLSGKATGIKYLSLNDKKLETYVAPTDTADFILTTYEAGKGVVTSSYVENTADWTKKPFELKTRFYTLDIAAKTIIPLVAPEEPSPNEQELIDNLKLDVLPNNVLIAKNPTYPNLLLITIRTNSSPYSTELYLVNKSDLTKFQKMGTGKLVDWR